MYHGIRVSLLTLLAALAAAAPPDRPAPREAARPVELTGHIVADRPEAPVAEGAIIRCEGTLEWRGVARPRLVMISLRTKRPPAPGEACAENDGRVTVVRDDKLSRSGSARWKASLPALRPDPDQADYYLEVRPLNNAYEPYPDAKGQPCIWSQKITIIKQK